MGSEVDTSEILPFNRLPIATSLKDNREAHIFLLAKLWKITFPETNTSPLKGFKKKRIVQSYNFFFRFKKLTYICFCCFQVSGGWRRKNTPSWSLQKISPFFSYTTICWGGICVVHLMLVVDFSPDKKTETPIIGKMLVPLGWYPSCLTSQGAL